MVFRTLSGEQSKIRGVWSLSLNNKSGVLNESIGVDVGSGNESSGTGIVKSAYGINIDVQAGNGTIDNGYGVFIRRVQGANTYGVYQQGIASKNYFEGSIGIGTTNPDMELTVKGKIHAEEVKIDLSVPAPDYVFKDDYNLRNIEEVEEFIKENNHLPEIPSAKEFEQNGVMQAEMDMNLLKKIEELTLYTIQQQKEITELKILIKNLLEKDKKKLISNH